MTTNNKNIINDLLSNNGKLIDEYTHKKHANKNEFILTEGKSASVAFYINKGITRSFILVDGKEITLQFNFPGDIVFPLNSFSENLISDESIQAITNLDYAKINLNEFDGVKQNNTELYELELKINELYTFQIAKRLRGFQTKSAKERYLELIKTEPEIAQFCQLSHIASYLGINLGSLSRIRSEF